MRRNFPKYKILTSEATINAIIENKMSVSRFGDGEFRLIMKERDIVFQNLKNGISERLLEVLNSSLQNHLVALPLSFKTTKGLKQDSKVHWLHFINCYGAKFSPFIYDKSKTYGNAFISRFYIDYKDHSKAETTVLNLKKIWNRKDVLIVEGVFSRLGVGNNLFDNATTLKRILCPAEHAFDRYDEILSLAKQHGENKLILIALGPTATVLAHDLAQLNYWAIDIGHVDVEYMWMLQKATKKVPIKGRYVSEAKSIKDYDILEEFKKTYEESILHKM